MTYEAFTAEVARAENILNAMANYPMRSFPESDISLEACECAAMLTGYDATTAKMLNREFRNNAAKAALEMAIKAA
ncbi:MAG: hypothetical protein RI571_16255 [Roseovarius sp.]|jgi:hypothetical protein|nr:hypothetical protein [Roseovarius sp.]